MSRKDRVLVIDGSNTVHAIFETWPDARGGHDRQAADFLNMLCAWAANQENLEIEAVFDGGYRPLAAPRSAAVRVLFSEHDKADAVIIERARALRFYGKKVTVVTWDRELSDSVRAEEAGVASPDRLLGAMKSGRSLKRSAN